MKLSFFILLVLIGNVIYSQREITWEEMKFSKSKKVWNSDYNEYCYEPVFTKDQKKILSNVVVIEGVFHRFKIKNEIVQTISKPRNPMIKDHLTGDEHFIIEDLEKELETGQSIKVTGILNYVIINGSGSYILSKAKIIQ